MRNNIFLVIAGMIVGAVFTIVTFSFVDFNRNEEVKKIEKKEKNIKTDTYQVEKVGELDLEPDCGGDNQVVFIGTLD